MKRDKAKLLYRDESFLKIISAKIRRMGMPCYLSLSDEDEEIPEDFTVLKDEVCDENGGFIGPVGGICTGLNACVRDELDGIFTLPVDLPLFETELFELIHKAMQKDPQADIYVLRTSDGRIHPACGYYRTGVLDTAKKLIHAHDYRLMSLIRHPALRTVYVQTGNAQQDRMLFNVNTPADYEELISKTGHRQKHIVLQGEKGVGKSALIRRLADEMQCTVGGYLSKAVISEEKGCREIYLLPASRIYESDDPDTARTYGKLCAVTMNRTKEVYPEVFDTYGSELISSAGRKQLIILDEIGFLEEKAELFKKAVLSALNGNVPVIAAIKAGHISSPFPETVRSHENVWLIEVNETNREEVYERLKRHYMHRKEDAQ